MFSQTTGMEAFTRTVKVIMPAVLLSPLKTYSIVYWGINRLVDASGIVSGPNQQTPRLPYRKDCPGPPPGKKIATPAL